jgi:hypothetical protein
MATMEAEGIRKVVDMFEKVEDDAPRIREEQSRQHEEEHSPLLKLQSYAPISLLKKPKKL